MSSDTLPHMGPCSHNRHWSHILCIARWILNRWEVLCYWFLMHYPESPKPLVKQTGIPFIQSPSNLSAPDSVILFQTDSLLGLLIGHWQRLLFFKSHLFLQRLLPSWMPCYVPCLAHQQRPNKHLSNELRWSVKWSLGVCGAIICILIHSCLMF